jgi:hypothetical protein
MSLLGAAAAATASPITATVVGSSLQPQRTPASVAASCVRPYNGRRSDNEQRNKKDRELYAVRSLCLRAARTQDGKLLQAAVRTGPGRQNPSWTALAADAEKADGAAEAEVKQKKMIDTLGKTIRGDVILASLEGYSLAECEAKGFGRGYVSKLRSLQKMRAEEESKMEVRRDNFKLKFPKVELPKHLVPTQSVACSLNYRPNTRRTKIVAPEEEALVRWFALNTTVFSGERGRSRHLDMQLHPGRRQAFR